jgi:hypothetical protein
MRNTPNQLPLLLPEDVLPSSTNTTGLTTSAMLFSFSSIHLLLKIQERKSFMETSTLRQNDELGGDLTMMAMF